jgi:hypothetical protein
LALLASCGRVDYDPLSACTSFSAFSTPRLVSGVNTTGSEFSPTLTGDQLTIYFHANRGADGLGSDDIWMASRDSRADDFGESTLVVEVSSSSADGAPSLSADGLTMFLSSARPGGVGGNDVWVATRSNPTASFGTPVVVAEVSSLSSETGPFISADGLTLYIGVEGTIVSASRPALDMPFETPTELVELDIGGTIGGPTLSDDELEIFFTGQIGGDSSELWVARRATRSDPFGTPELVSEVNSPSADFSAELTDGGRTLYLTSSRAGGVGADDLYVATRSCGP